MILGSSVAWMSSLCNNYIFDYLYLISLFSLDSGFIYCSSEFKVLVFYFHMLCSSDFLKPRVLILFFFKICCCKDDLNANLCFFFIYLFIIFFFVFINVELLDLPSSMWGCMTLGLFILYLYCEGTCFR